MSAIAFPAPPKDFDPLTANDRSLAKFGLPRRPDADTEPELRNLWDAAFARKPTFVEAELVEDQPWPLRPQGAGKKRQFGSAGQGAGAYIDVSSLGLSPAEPGNMVFAEWKVPTISTKPKEPGPQTVAFWVGLGGVTLSPGDVPALLQATTAAGITDGGKACNLLGVDRMGSERGPGGPVPKRYTPRWVRRRSSRFSPAT